MSIPIPAKLSATCQNNPENARWLHELPGVLRSLQQRWSLVLGNPFDGDEISCAWVAPVTVEGATSAILKLGMPHFEGEHEIQGLRFWGGDPTVRLLEADDEIGAMLLERCEPGTPLRALPEVEQDAVISRLLQRLWRVPPVPDRFRPLAAMTRYWIDEITVQSEHWPDSGLVAEGLRLFAELSNPTERDVLLATDLHAGNVLRAQREPWLVIDPKPFIGDPAYDATQHLLNCYARLRSDPDTTIRRFAGLLNLDHQRVRAWTFARAAARAGVDLKNDRWLELARAISI